jgi:hypothetical protein
MQKKAPERTLTWAARLGAVGLVVSTLIASSIDFGLATKPPDTAAIPAAMTPTSPPALSCPSGTILTSVPKSQVTPDQPTCPQASSVNTGSPTAAAAAVVGKVAPTTAAAPTTVGAPATTTTSAPTTTPATTTTTAPAPTTTQQATTTTPTTTAPATTTTLQATTTTRPTPTPSCVGGTRQEAETMTVSAGTITTNNTPTGNITYRNWTPQNLSQLQWPVNTPAVRYRFAYSSTQTATRRLRLRGAYLTMTFPSTSGQWAIFETPAPNGYTVDGLEMLYQAAEETGTINLDWVDNCPTPLTLTNNTPSTLPLVTNLTPTTLPTTTLPTTTPATTTPATTTTLTTLTTLATTTTRPPTTPTTTTPGASAPLSSAEGLRAGYMGSRVFGLPFAVDRSNDPVIGVGTWGETYGRNAEVGIAFRSPYTGKLDAIRPLFTDDTSFGTGTGYAGGTGGIIEISLFNADSAGRPTGNAITSFVWLPGLVNGKTCEPICSGYQLQRVRRIDFPTNPDLVTDAKYVVSFRNTDPNPAVNFVRFHGVDIYENSTVGGNSYIAEADGFDRSVWGTVFRYPGTAWSLGNRYPTGTVHSGYDPILSAGLILADGRSFGNAGFNVGVDHGRIRGPQNPLGTGCEQGFASTVAVQCNVQGTRKQGQRFSTPTTFTTDRVYLPLVPYEAGNITVTLIDKTNNATLTSCSFVIPTMDQSPSHPDYAYIRSRKFSCNIPATQIVAGLTYDLLVSADATAVASVMVLGDMTTWPYQPAPPFHDALGASIPGRYLTTNANAALFVTHFDLQYGLRII